MICPPEYDTHLKQFPATIWKDPNNKVVPTRKKKSIKKGGNSKSTITLAQSESEIKLGFAKAAQRELRE